MESKLFINGQWVDGGPMLEVTNKYTGAVIGALPTARREDMDAAISAAQAATRLMAEMPAYRRSEILSRAAALMRENRQDLARTIAAEAGKALKFALAEVDRAISTFTFAAEEAKRQAEIDRMKIEQQDKIRVGQNLFTVLKSSATRVELLKLKID